MLNRLSAGMVLSAALVAAPFGLASDQPQDTARTRIEQQVRRELVILPSYSLFDFLSFRVDGDTVVLMGKVTRPTLKSDAEQAIRKIEGVRIISNQIQVLRLSPDDDRLRADLYKAIYGHAALQALATRAIPPIHILVENRDVTLEGAVAAYLDKTVAGVQAHTVPGVYSVVNNLVIEK